MLISRDVELLGIEDLRASIGLGFGVVRVLMIVQVSKPQVLRLGCLMTYG